MPTDEPSDGQNNDDSGSPPDGFFLGGSGLPPEFLEALERKIAAAKRSFNRDEIAFAIRQIIEEEDIEVDAAECAEEILSQVSAMQLHLQRAVNGEEDFTLMVRRMAHHIRTAKSTRHTATTAELLEAMSPNDKIQAMFDALMSAREDPRVNYREQREHTHHQNLLRALSRMADKLSRNSNALNEVAEASTLIRLMSNPQKMGLRRQSQRKNPHAELLDDAVVSLDSDLLFARAFLESASEFRQQAGPLLQMAETQTGIGFSDAIRETALGFYDVVDRMKDRAESFAERCSHFLERLEQYHLRLGYAFCPPDDYTDRRGRRQANSGTPLHNDNLHQTALLYGMETHIPAAKLVTGKKEDGTGNLGYDDSAAKGFAEFLKGQGDINLLKHTSAPEYFRVLSRAIGTLHRTYVQFTEEYEGAEIDEIFTQGPAGARQAFAVRINQTLEANSLAGTDNVKRFDPAETVEILASMDMSKPPLEDEGEPVDWHIRDAKSPDDKQRIAIFKKLEEVVVKIGNERNSVGWAVLKEDIEELMRMKAGLSKTKQSRRRRLNQDKDRDNITYGVAGGTPYDPLHLEQIPSEHASWDDLVGSSWKDIKDKLDAIYGHAKMSRVFTDLAPRRQINSNAILIGPPGSGKNLAVRAMMSDPRTVGIATTVGELMSEYVGRGQHNVKDLYDEAQRVREEHDKPAIIALDEFEIMFPEKEGGATSTIKRDMQKAFQAVLDGHMLRDGVFTVGLTNNPENIPAAVLRRFAHVEIIETLRRDERMILLENLLKGIPQEDGFYDKVDWDRIMQESEFASGDTLGKIADATYLKYLELFEARHPRRLQRIHERIGDMKDRGLQRLSDAQKVRLFHAGKGSNTVLTAETFQNRALEVLEGNDAQSDMRAQEHFYEVVRRLLDEGFMGRRL